MGWRFPTLGLECDWRLVRRPRGRSRRSPEWAAAHRRLRTIALGALLCAVTAPEVAAQSVIGVVTDSARRPLPEADVIVGPSGLRARTDSAGRFTVRLAKGGRSEVMVRLVGYRQYVDTVRVPAFGAERITIRLERLPPRLAARIITDRRECAEFALSGFECRRDSGIGYFRDAGELRAMRPRHWADMLDGFPGLRRDTRFNLTRVAPMPSRCLREIYNGSLPLWLADEERRPDDYWIPNDVVAIEYYPEYRQVPPQYQRYAWWPPLMGQPCGLIVYWVRGADATERPRRGAPPRQADPDGLQRPR